MKITPGKEGVNLDTLPRDLFSIILPFLDVRQLLYLRCLHKRFRDHVHECAGDIIKKWLEKKIEEISPMIQSANYCLSSLPLDDEDYVYLHKMYNKAHVKLLCDKANLKTALESFETDENKEKIDSSSSSQERRCDKANLKTALESFETDENKEKIDSSSSSQERRY